MRAEYYPVVTRKNTGVALYDVATNTVRIGGVGSVPEDVGTSERVHFAPRLGAAYRIGDKWVVRGGFGVSTDPFSLARLFRTNYPAIVAMDIVPANSFGFVGRTEDGIPPVPIPDLGNGIIAIPGNVTATAMEEEFNRGYTQSYNVTVQRELNWGFVGTGRLRRIAHRPSAPDDGTQLRAAWRWQRRQNPESAVRPHGEHDTAASV